MSSIPEPLFCDCCDQELQREAVGRVRVCDICQAAAVKAEREAIIQMANATISYLSSAEAEGLPQVHGHQVLEFFRNDVVRRGEKPRD